MPDKTPQEEIDEIISTESALSAELVQLEQELAEIPKFKEFIAKQAQLRDAQSKSSEIWKRIESQMIDNNIKSIKGDWGSITIAERDNFKASNLELVPRKFIKKTLDTTKISQFYKLEDKLPAGVEHTTSKYLTKRLKG